MRNEWMKDCHKGEDVFILAGGPSLQGFDFKRLRGRTVIAVNFSIMHWPEAQYLVGLDAKFFTGLRAEGIDPYKMDCRIIAGGSAAIRPMGNMSVVVVCNNPSLDPRKMYGPMSSTLVALNFAIISGAKRIFLLGVDQKYSSNSSEDGKGIHFYDKFYHGQYHREEEAYTRVAKAYRAFVGMADIYNLNPDSGVTCFPFEKVDNVLPLTDKGEKVES